MNVFGPFYPPALQAAVNHAELLAELLVVHELAPPTEEWAQAWTVGRADEVARFAEHVVSLWRDGKLANAEATAMLDGYLGALHDGMARHLGCRAPSCCLASSAATARPARRGDRGGDRSTHPATDDPTALGTIDSVLLEQAFGPAKP